MQPLVLEGAKPTGARGYSWYIYILALEMARPEVFNLCHAVDPTEILSSGGGPHGPRRTGFNLSYSWFGQPEHVLLRLRTQTT